MKGILHIGMPKCMSTSIQAYLREAPNIFFMGIGPSQFVKPDVLLAFQRHIARIPAHFYDAAAVARVFQANVEEAKTADTQLFAFSDETIPFPRGYARADTSYVERMQRLKAVMPEDTSVLMIVRNPNDYLQSSYRYRCVMNGMNCSYEDYLKRLLLVGDTNFLGTIKYFHFAEVARQIFGKVNLVAMEAIEDDERELLRLLGANGLSAPVHGQLPRANSGMPNNKFANFRELHAPYGNALADDDFNGLSPADRMMTRTDTPYFSGVLSSSLAREQTLKGLRALAIEMPDKPSAPCFEMSDETRKLLAEYVEPSNAMLKKHYDVAVDDYGYNLF
ncbi:MAG TPA: hypothetical protein VGH02_15480 [Rhizomicrobium sp.]|jgi:hypothetical protein